MCLESSGQVKDDWDSIPKMTEKIKVTNSLTADENFMKVSEVIMDNDYTFSSRDKELKLVTTEMKPLKYGSIKLSFRCQDSTVTVTGVLLSGITVELYGVRSEDNPEKVVKRGMKKSIYGYVFSEMNRMAKLIPGEVTYH